MRYLIPISVIDNPDQVQRFKYEAKTSRSAQLWISAICIDAW